MTSVYGNAMLTIIAAAGEDTNHGLPGLDPFRSVHKVTNLGRYQIVKSHLPAGVQSFETTTWATRAWTYQELLLSPRSLVYLDTHVEWLCRCTEWSEELDLEHPNFNVTRYYFSKSQQPHKLVISNYKWFVHEYRRRNLTFEADIVNAFTGIMAAINSEVFSGLPHSTFGESLAWEVEKGTPENIPDQRRNCGFAIPSWSWLSWRGVIKLQNDLSKIIHESLLTAYRWRRGRLEQICAPKTTSVLSDDLTTMEVPDSELSDSEWTVRIDDLPSDVKLNENQLIFWAPTVTNTIPEGYKYVITGRDFRHVIALHVTWRDKIAPRLGRVLLGMEDWSLESSVKKLIIME